MAVGFPTKVNYATGDVLSATNMNDLSGTVNLLESAQYAAGKNKIINGDFGIWQRGTSISLSNGTSAYGPDRFIAQCNFSAGTSSISRQTFTPGTAPVAGYEGTYYARLTCGSTSTLAFFAQRIEDVRVYAGQTITVSAWFKSSVATDGNIYVYQNFGSGGSATVTVGSSTGSITTSWTRLSYTVAVPSITGKTIGTSSYLDIQFTSTTSLGSATIDYWGVQVEAASSASVFQTATGTKQAELAACQRYYYRVTAGAAYGFVSQLGSAQSTTAANVALPLKVTMRVNPTAVEYANLTFNDGTNLVSAGTLVVSGGVTSENGQISSTTAGLTAFRPYFLSGNNNAAGYLALTAEL